MARSYEEAKEALRQLKINKATGSGKFDRKTMAQLESVMRAKKQEQAMLDQVNTDLGAQVEQQSIKVNPDGKVAKPGEHTGPGFTTNPFKMSQKSPIGKLFGFGNKEAAAGQKAASAALGAGSGMSGMMGQVLGAEDATSGVVGGAMTGFSMGGPVGALIGGGLGAIMGSQKAKAAEKRRAEARAEAEKQRELHRQLERSKVEQEKGRRLQDALHNMQAQFGATLNSIG